MNDSHRRYSDAEMRNIIEKALSLQKQASTTDGESDREGVTLDEIDAIAREAGIPSALIRRAASEIESESIREKPNRFLGGTIDLGEVRLVNRVAPQRELERVVAMIPSITGETGSGNVMGGSLSWATGADVVQRTGHSIDIAVTPSGGQSVVRVRNRLGQIAGGLFGGLMGGLGLCAGLGVGLGVGLKALGSVPFAVLFPIGTVLGGYLIARLAFSLFTKARKSRIRDIADSIAGLLENAGVASGPENR